MQMEIRRYEPRDRVAVREVCRATAYAGDGDALLDPRLFTDLMIRAWTDFGAGPLWVVEREGTVEGYLAGCFDLRRFTRIQTWQVIPSAVARALAGGLLLRPALWRLVAGLPRFIATSRVGPQLDGFPCELHINFLPPARGRKLGTQLVELFLKEAARLEMPGVHATVYEDNEPARQFFEHLGFRPLGRRPAFRPLLAVRGTEWKIVYGRKVDR
jgi:GNAT superfamily N-acetyltransferase